MRIIGMRSKNKLVLRRDVFRIKRLEVIFAYYESISCRPFHDHIHLRVQPG